MNTKSLLHTTLTVVLLCCAAIARPIQSQDVTRNLMPLPASLEEQDGSIVIDSTFSVALTGTRDPRMVGAAERLLARLSAQTGLVFNDGLVTDPAKATLILHAETGGNAVQEYIEDESYRLSVTDGKIRIESPEPYGAMHGIETFLQLVSAEKSGFVMPAVRIDDRPRFPWRGLMIDASRHWMPKEMVFRNLDAMAAVKLNVLHWHLADDQGFRVRSNLFPRLTELGSDGLFYTHDDVREVIAYAWDRGIRVVPEFDIPGHTTAWVVGYPELATAPGPYNIERGWGIFHPTLDPSKEEVYTFLDGLIGEMAALFPDAFFHIGGDEVSGKQWEESEHIQAFIRENNLKDNHGLQAYFNGRINQILTKYGKKMVGWDEIFHPDLPKNIVIHSWRGQKSLAESSRQGYQGILSFGWYHDHMRPASYQYGIDPLSGDAATLNDAEKQRILGGEAPMWAEFVNNETVDSRIWPRMAVVAERLWSPANKTTDVNDMYRRLESVDRWLTTVGLRHRTNYLPMLERMTEGRDVSALKTLVDVLEPVKNYQRGTFRNYTQRTPLNRIVDAARPESEVARHFSNQVGALIANRNDRSAAAAVRESLIRWRDNGKALEPLYALNEMTAEAAPLSAMLTEIASVGLEAEAAVSAGKKLSSSRRTALNARLDAIKPLHAVEAAILPAIKKLVQATN